MLMLCAECSSVGAPSHAMFCLHVYVKMQNKYIQKYKPHAFKHQETTFLSKHKPTSLSRSRCSSWQCSCQLLKLLFDWKALGAALLHPLSKVGVVGQLLSRRLKEHRVTRNRILLYSLSLCFSDLIVHKNDKIMNYTTFRCCLNIKAWILFIC